MGHDDMASFPCPHSCARASRTGAAQSSRVGLVVKLLSSSRVIDLSPGGSLSHPTDQGLTPMLLPEPW